ncbi:class I SAM-dependent methyltransferase [Acrocarpospora catenulata]|uniref:class I SAM-dependent methyltransferase n=1 Tax=Acrocarpospora catenulata TaxID=2836182 RepID=UPI001BD9E5FF|nr:class I SAM-dependent methyltransferase [Acrocarpospora catenulata]
MDTTSRCLVCGTDSLEGVVSLTPTPPANAIASTAEAARAQERYPLDLVRCAMCGLVQLVDVVPRSVLFADYRYATGAAPALVEHCRALATRVTDRLGLDAGAKVLEIGSNDGTQLSFFAERGMTVLGVDPAVELGTYAQKHGVPTLTTHFGVETVEKILSDIGPVDAVLGSNVLAHVNDVNGVLRAIRLLLKPGGRAVIEVAHVLPMVQHGIFEFVYHEHLSYFSLHVLAQAAAANGLAVFDAELIPAQGGSLRCWIGRDDEARPSSIELDRILRAEVDAGVPDGSFLDGFADRVNRVCTTLNDVLAGLSKVGGRICGYGASARAVTLLSQAGVGGQIAWIVDDNPRKVGKFTPGDGIPIVSSERLTAEAADYCVLFAWNFEASIRARSAAFTAGGGAFVVPFPELAIR